SFQIGGSSGEAGQIGLKSMRTDGINMGGFSYVANGMANDSWEVKSNQNDMTMSFNDRFGQPQEITINAKTGDDIEELATYINGQTDLVSASVNDEGQLQIYM
ncbi:flagellin hook IN motif-containing protein, partial [Vibrio cyclitrophicus]|uniref:flagellin hook IN motif-containing protein n=1 Tax=Vibrio cyclitrophicus TaxID=47951 RepID=UPI0028F6F63F